MTSMNRQQATAVVTTLGNVSGNVVRVIIEEVTSEMLKGAVAITAMFPGSRKDEQYIIAVDGNVLRLS